jgi:hypothetical protein
VFKLCYIPNEPFLNESLALINKTYATINHNLFCQIVVMDAFVCDMICKSWTCFVLGQASDLKRANCGRNPKLH